MAKVFVTGSADGLGKLSAQLLIEQGHDVLIHARNEKRAEKALINCPGSAGVVVGDLASITQTVLLAKRVNELGSLDAVIHNAGVGYQDSGKSETEDGLPTIFAVNSLSPYILTCLITKPKRLIYLSSGLHLSGNERLDDLLWEKRRWNGFAAYSDSKLHDVILAFAVARKWQEVYSNALEPGWVATRMGGANAPDDLDLGRQTQSWLAVSNDTEACVSGKYFFHKRIRNHHPAAENAEIQEKFLGQCADISGIKFPDAG